MRVEQITEFLEALDERFDSPLSRGVANMAGDVYLSALSDIRFLRQLRTKMLPEGKVPQMMEISIMEKMVEVVIGLIGVAERFEEDSGGIQVH